ncbi:MAG: peptide ABC transporter substrate-binding protein [Treponema sp.]|nr:peptide ABC transporter substrate-binding protein [Treponema sp.]
MKKNKSISLIFTLLFIFTGFYAFSQENEKDEIQELLESEIKKDDIYNYINSELQKNFTIVVSRHNFDLNPHTSAYSVEAQILTGLYEGLFSYDPITLNPEYALATSYRISRDKKRWTFTLRDGIKESDGSPITSENIRDSWLRLLETKNAPFSSLFDIVRGAKDFREGKGERENVGITCPDEKTISLHLNNPASHLAKILCMPSFALVPQDIHVFSGPFVIKGFDGISLVLEKNPNYWDREHTPLEKITFILNSDKEENAYLFNTGLADWVTSSIDVKRVIQKDVSHLSAEFATEYLFFKVKEDSIWSKKDFRAALLEAVPWEELRKDTFVKATTLVYPLSGYPQVQGYVYTDKEEAISLMKECRKKYGIESQQELTITIAVNEGDWQQKQAEILKKAWEPLGVKVESLVIPSSEYLNKIEEGQADLYSYTWIGDFADPLAFLELFRKNSTLNVSGWKNDEFERLIEEASLVTDESHGKLLAQAEQLLLDEAEILPIQHPVSFNIIDLNAVGGWASNSFDIHPLKYLFKRETKPKVPNVVMAK